MASALEFAKLYGCPLNSLNVPLGLRPVLERYNLDTEHWVRNVESYGGLFYRIVGPIESIAARAREKGLPWLRGQKGSRELYKTPIEAA